MDLEGKKHFTVGFKETLNGGGGGGGAFHWVFLVFYC